MDLLKGPKECMHCIGEFQSRLLLTTLYFVMLGPFSLLAGKDDPLRLTDFSSQRPTGWMPRRPDTGRLEEARQQF